jgi:hypothetical protein
MAARDYLLRVDGEQAITLTSGDVKLDVVESIGIRRALDTLLHEQTARVQTLDPTLSPRNSARPDHPRA